MKTPNLNTVLPSLHRRLTRSILVGLIVLGAHSAHGAPTPPDFMTYQGFLVDGNGNALAPSTPANYPVVFRIYDVATGGTVAANLKWSEQQIVTVDKGNFSVVLGEGTAVAGEPRPALPSVFTGGTASDRYMGLSVTVGSSTLEILPRLRILPAPYSMLSLNATALVSPNGNNLVSAANGILVVNGAVSASGGVTGLTAAQVPNLNASQIAGGTLSDALLSADVARRSGGNSFLGTQRIGGDGAGAAAGTVPGQPADLLVTGNINISSAFGPGSPVSLSLDTPIPGGGGALGVATRAGDWSTDAAGGFNSGDLVLRASTGKLLLQSGGGASAIAITSANTVGIGTPLPTARLHVFHPPNPAVVGDSPFLISKPSSAVLWVRTFAAGGSYNLELFEGQAYKPGGGSWGVVSDERLKKNVHSLTGALDSLLQLRSVSFEYKDPTAIHELPGRHNGFIAQEVEKVFPEWVNPIAGGMKAVSPVGFESLTVQALREIREEKDSQIQTLRKQNEDLKSRLDEMQQVLQDLVAARKESKTALTAPNR